MLWIFLFVVIKLFYALFSFFFTEIDRVPMDMSLQILISNSTVVESYQLLFKGLQIPSELFPMLLLNNPFKNQIVVHGF